MKDMVLKGTVREEDSLPVVPFKLDRERTNVPTHVEIEFIAEGVHYSYGFEVTTRHVEAEWLFQVDPDGSEHPLYERTSPKGAMIELGVKLSDEPERRGYLGYVARGTRENQLFLAEAGQKPIEELAPIRKFLRGWTLVSPDSASGRLLPRMLEDARFNDAMSDILRGAGTGIDNLLVKKRVLDDLPPPWMDLLKSAEETDTAVRFTNGQILRLDAQRRVEALDLWAKHRTPDGTEVELNIAEESDGTRRLLNLAPLLHPPDDDAHTLCVIDELDRSLHPLLTQLFLQRFLAGQRQTSQLVFTTHDTSILDFNNLLSRDSLGFIEKDPAGASVTYPLSELNQTQVDEVERLGHGLADGYLQGRFGAIPFFGARTHVHLLIERLPRAHIEPAIDRSTLAR